MLSKSPAGYQANSRGYLEGAGDDARCQNRRHREERICLEGRTSGVRGMDVGLTRPRRKSFQDGTQRLRGCSADRRIVCDSLDAEKVYGRAPSPCVAWQAGFYARLVEERLAIPAKFGGDLGEE